MGPGFHDICLNFGMRKIISDPNGDEEEARFWHTWEGFVREMKKWFFKIFPGFYPHGCRGLSSHFHLKVRYSLRAPGSNFICFAEAVVVVEQIWDYFFLLKWGGILWKVSRKNHFQILAASERRTRKTLPIWGPKRGEVSVGRIFCEEYQRQLVQPTTVWQYFRVWQRFSMWRFCFINDHLKFLLFFL